jgi:hypothetical protein
MSIWNVDAFCNSPFKETVVYTPTGAAAISIADAVVSRKNKDIVTFPRMDQSQSKYDTTLLIRRSHVATVTENKDRVNAADTKGVNKDYIVKEIIEATPESWMLGLV